MAQGLEWVFFIIYGLVTPGLMVFAGVLALARRMALVGTGFFIMGALGVLGMVVNRFVTPSMMEEDSFGDLLQLYHGVSSLVYAAAWALVVFGLLKIASTESMAQG